MIKFIKTSTMKTTKSLTIGTLSLLLFSYSCDQKPKEKIVSETPVVEETVVTEEEKTEEKEITYDVNQPKTIITAVAEASGGWNNVWDLNDIEYDYTYEQGGKKDISKERYIFKGEHSWGSYTTHEVNVLPPSEKVVIQNFVNGKATASIDGKESTDAKVVGTSAFLRQVNYFWLLMNFKLEDPETIYKYIGQEEVGGVNYEKVSISYNPEKTGKEANDIYIVYVNPTTKLIDQFYFSLPAFGVNDPVILMKVKYTEIDGIQIPTTRHAFMPGKDGKYPETPSIIQLTENVKFNNGFKAEDLKI